jgi:glutaredoxin
VKLNSNQGLILNVCHQDWISGFLSQDKNLIGLLPCPIALIKKDNEVLVGSGDPNLIGKLTDNPQIVTIAKQAENTLKNIINEAAGVGPLKVKEIKLYATMSCPYCKMEASWLDENKVKYRHIFVDLDQRAAEEMVRKTGQMGVPVTEIVYDNDEQEYIIGFDKERLEEILLKN